MLYYDFYLAKYCVQNDHFFIMKTTELLEFAILETFNASFTLTEIFIEDCTAKVSVHVNGLGLILSRRSH